MKPGRWFALAGAGALIAFASCQEGRVEDVLESPDVPAFQDQKEAEAEAEEVERRAEDGEARILASFFFPLFPQYQTIDIGANLNNLKSPNTVAFFIIRDALTVGGSDIALSFLKIIYKVSSSFSFLLSFSQYVADFVFWWTMNALFWDGRIERDSEAPVVIQLFSKLFNAGMDVQRNIQKNIFGRTTEEINNELYGNAQGVVTQSPSAAVKDPYFPYGRLDVDPYGDAALGHHPEQFNEIYYDADVVDNPYDFKKKQGFPIPGIGGVGGIPGIGGGIPGVGGLPGLGGIQNVGDVVPPPPGADRVLDHADEVSFNGLFNFFANPDPSFRNLIMNTGFVSSKVQDARNYCMVHMTSPSFPDLLPTDPLDAADLLLAGRAPSDSTDDEGGRGWSLRGGQVGGAHQQPGTVVAHRHLQQASVSAMRGSESVNLFPPRKLRDLRFFWQRALKTFLPLP